VRTRYFLLIIGLGTNLFYSCGQEGRDSEPQIAVPVSVKDVQPRSINEYISSTGTVQASKEAALTSQINGYYELQTNHRTGKPYKTGDNVNKDELILKLDSPETINTVRIESQKLNLDISQREYEKQQSLYEKGGVTLRELVDSERAFRDARYSYNNALLELQKMEIRAPFTGVITELPYYTPGVKVGLERPMVTVMNYTRLYLDLDLAGNSFGRVSESQSARITNYSFPDDTLTGSISQVAPAIQPATRSFSVGMMIENPDLLLRPGMFVKSEIIIAARDSTIVVPKHIIQSNNRGKIVYVVEKGAASERLIQTGIENPDFIEVTEGLKLGDRLVIKGFETLSNRSKIKIVR
jgi:membrane fusion protein, multidrug efflux system